MWVSARAIETLTDGVEFSVGMQNSARGQEWTIGCLYADVLLPELVCKFVLLSLSALAFVETNEENGKDVHMHGALLVCRLSV